MRYASVFVLSFVLSIIATTKTNAQYGSFTPHNLEIYNTAPVAGTLHRDSHGFVPFRFYFDHWSHYQIEYIGFEIILGNNTSGWYYDADQLLQDPTAGTAITIGLTLTTMAIGTGRFLITVI